MFSIFGAGSFLEAFSTWKHKKIDKVCLYSYVFYCFMNFFCILLFFYFYVFYCFMISAVWDLDLDQYQADLMIHVQSKTRTNYWFTGQNEKFTLPFVLYTKWKKFSLFGLTFGRKRSRDSVTGGPIFANLVSKYPQDFKEKSHEAARLKARRFCVRGKICLGGASEAPPPPQCS